MTLIDELILETRDFARRREWLAFHTPKNLAMAIAGEAGELASELRWLTPEEASPEHLSEERRRDVSWEMADVFIFLLRLSDVLGVDLAAATREKMTFNEERFPVIRGNDASNDPR